MDQNKAVVRRLFAEVFTRGDLSVADEVMAADRTIHPSLRNALPGIEGLKATVTGFHQTFADFRADIETLVAEGDRVVAEITWRGRHTGNWRGLPPTGREVAWREIDILRLVDGKIVDVRWISEASAAFARLKEDAST